MKKVCKIIITFFLLLLCIYISFCALGHIKDSNYFYKIGLNPYIINILGTVVLFLIINLIFLLLKKFKIEKSRKITYICFFIIIVLQIVFVLNIQTLPINDPGILLDEAISMTKDKDMSGEIHWGYFTRNTQNQFFVYFMSVIFSVSKLFNIDDFLLVKDIVNIIAIDLSILFSYLIIKRLKDEKLSIKFLILTMFNPLIYIMTPYMYTNTISLPFLAAIILLFIIIKQSKEKKQKIIFSILLGLIAGLGFLIRVTTIISVIAIIIYVGVFVLFPVNKEKIKKLVIFASLFCITFGGTYLLGNYAKNKFIKFDDTETRFPIYHWVMMGAKYPGTYDAKDVSFTQKFDTYEEKKIANLTMLSERIKENGIGGTIKLIGNKMSVVWAQGTNKYEVVLAESRNYDGLYKYVVGSKNDFVAYYAQIYRALTFILIVISLISYIKNKKSDMMIINYLILLGAIVFFIIWEANKTYGMSFMPIMMILAADGIGVINNISIKKFNKVFYNAIISIAIIIFIIIAVLNYNNFTTINKYTDIDYSVNQTKSSVKYIYRIYGEKVVLQTFSTDKDFNSIKLNFKNPRKVEGVEYFIEIFDVNDNLLHREIVLSEKVGDRNSVITFETIKPNGRQVYKIKIYSPDATYEKSLNLTSYMSKNYDKVEYGKLYVNNKDVNGDLKFSVYNSKQTAYFSKPIYILICVTIVVFMVAIMIGYNKIKKDDIINKK